MDASATTPFTTTAVSALVSTGITLLYILLKVFTYFTDATARYTQRQEKETTDGQKRYPQQGGGTRGQGTGKVLQQTQRPSDI